MAATWAVRPQTFNTPQLRVQRALVEIATEKSTYGQLGIYGSWSLTRDIDRRFQIQWLVGPELHI